MRSMISARLAAVLTFLLAVPAPAGAPAKWKRTGKISIVSLLEVARAATAVPKLDLGGAADGVQLAFLIVSKPGEQGLFALTELRDVKIDGKSYHDATQAKLDKEFEPVTKLIDTDKFQAERTDLNPAIGSLPADRKSVVMVTAIGGAELPASGQGSVTIEVGWGRKTETFAFRFDLKGLRSPADVKT